MKGFEDKELEAGYIFFLWWTLLKYFPSFLEFPRHVSGDA
jgi:hypothetical protein